MILGRQIGEPARDRKNRGGVFSSFYWRRAWREFGAVFLTLALLAAVYITADVRQQREHMLSLHEQKAKALLISMEASLEAGMMAEANLTELSSLLNASPDFQDIGYIVLWADGVPYLLYPPAESNGGTGGKGGAGKGDTAGAENDGGLLVPSLASPGGRPLPVNPGEFQVRTVKWRGQDLLEVIKPVDSGRGWHRMMGMGYGMGWQDRGNPAGYLAVGLRLADVWDMVAGQVWRSILIGLLILVAGGLVLFLLVVQEKNLLTKRLLASTETLTKSILDNVANGVIALDEQGNIVAFNREAERITGLAARDVVGKEFSTLVPREWEPGRLLLDTWKTGKSHLEVDTTPVTKAVAPGLQTSDGGKWGTPVVVSTTPLPALETERAKVGEAAKDAARAEREPRMAGAVAILRDVTRLKELEEDLRRRERLAALGRLSAGLAHEIRNPLGAIKGIAQFLRRELPPGDERAEDLDVIVRESNRLNRLVQDILTYARESRPKLEPIKMDAILKEAVSLVRAHRGQAADVLRLAEPLPEGCKAVEGTQTGVEARAVEAGGSRGMEVLADREQLKQVLINLLENALDAVEPLGAKGLVELGCLGASGDPSGPSSSSGTGKTVGFYVADNGPGVPASERSRIFDPFYTTKEAGTGLGLSIAHRLVVNHGGTLEVSDQPGGGARFEVRLPVGAAAGGDGADMDAGDVDGDILETSRLEGEKAGGGSGTDPRC